jgi:hypothetical protein
LGRVEKYNRAAMAFQPMTPTILSKDIIVALCQLHPLLLVHLFSPMFDYKLEHFILNRTLFMQVLTIVSYLFFKLFRMVYEHFSRCFIPKDSSLKFSKLFQVIITIAHGDISKFMTLMLGPNRLLAMAKDTTSLRPITICEMFL